MCKGLCGVFFEVVWGGDGLEVWEEMGWWIVIFRRVIEGKDVNSQGKINKWL